MRKKLEAVGQGSHQLLIQKLLVSTHYLTLFKDELILVEKTPSLLGGSFAPSLVQSELGDILKSIETLDKQERLIKSTFWYDEHAFNLLNKSLSIVDNWIEGIDRLVEVCEEKSVFHTILGESRARVFGVLADVFSSLKVINLSLKEDYVHPALFEQIRLMKLEEEALQQEQ